VNFPSRYGGNALEIACFQNLQVTAHALVQAGADVNRGGAPLALAASFGHTMRSPGVPTRCSPADTCKAPQGPHHAIPAPHPNLAFRQATYPAFHKTPSPASQEATNMDYDEAISIPAPQGGPHRSFSRGQAYDEAIPIPVPQGGPHLGFSRGQKPAYINWNFQAPVKTCSVVGMSEMNCAYNSLSSMPRGRSVVQFIILCRL
jgi:hypothetical protein